MELLRRYYTNPHHVVKKKINNSLSARLKGLIEQSGSTIKGVAADCGIPYRTLYNYISGRNKPTAEILNHIAVRLGTSSDWLLTGTGPMTVNEKQALYSIRVNDTIAEHNRAVFKNMCGHLELIINKGDFLMQSAVQTQLAAFAQQIEAKEPKTTTKENKQ